MDKRKIIIDTDPGIDDAFAIIAAIKYDGFDVLGLTTVAGNKNLDNVTYNALRLVEFLNADIPVYKGASKPLVKVFNDAGEVHGPTGFGHVELEDKGTEIRDLAAVDFIIETVKNNDDVELITLGPLTNIALAIQKDPETMKKVKSIWSMGGGVYRGNVTPVAEFNYWVDPEAVQVVFEFGKHIDIHMVGIEPSRDSSFDANELMFMRFSGGELGKTLYQMVDYYIERYFGYIDEIGAVIYDLLTVIYAIDPSICDIHYSNVEVSLEGITSGMTVVDIDNKYGKEQNVYIAMNTDAHKFKKLFFDIVFPESEYDYEDYFWMNEQIKK
ncbi:nucleoside hydrolase [Mycoplasmatota bacterium WC44]